MTAVLWHYDFSDKIVIFLILEDNRYGNQGYIWDQMSPFFFLQRKDGKQTRK